MTFIITATATFSSQANRDAARTRVDSAVAAVDYSAYSTIYTAGLSNPSATVMTISIRLTTLDFDLARQVMEGLVAALVSSNRPVTYSLSLSRLSP